MSIQTKAFHLQKYINYNAASPIVVDAFHRNHVIIEMMYDGSEEDKFSHYTCFNALLADLQAYLNKACVGLWTFKHSQDALHNGPACKEAL